MGVIEETLDIVKRRNPGEKEFLQAVTEVLESVRPVIESNTAYQDGRILDRIELEFSNWR